MPGTRFSLAFLVTLLVACHAGAQSPTVLPSLEWLTDSSELVVRASVDDIEIRSSWVVAKLSVKETLKGHWQEGLPASVYIKSAPGIIERWKASGVSSVWFLSRTYEGRPEGSPRTAFVPIDVSMQTIELGSPKIPKPILSMDLTAIDEEEALLAAIKAEAQINPNSDNRAIRLTIPTWVSVRVGSSDANNILLLPHSPGMERLARRQVTPLSWLHTREIGLTILEHFKSDENIAVVRKLAADGGPLAAHAIAVLKSWNVAVDEPNRKNWPHIDLKRAASPRPVRVSIDGVEVPFKGVSPPRIIAGRAYARACTISKPLGAEMYSAILESGKGVEIRRGALHIYMPVESHTIWVNDLVEKTDLTSLFIKDEGFFPIRFIAEKFGATVDWDPRRHMVLIRTRHE